jgi:MFS superfamily sulfate permease-like transporter
MAGRTCRAVDCRAHLPEAVAYAGIAGLAPGRALIAAVAGGLVYTLIGRSRFAVVSATSSSASILAASLGSLAATPLLPERQRG